MYDYPVIQTGAEENWKIKKVYFVNQGMDHYDAIHFWEIIIIINTSYYYHYFPKFNQSVRKLEFCDRGRVEKWKRKKLGSAKESGHDAYENSGGIPRGKSF